MESTALFIREWLSECSDNILDSKAEGFPEWKVDVAFLFSRWTLGLATDFKQTDFSLSHFPTLGFF